MNTSKLKMLALAGLVISGAAQAEAMVRVRAIDILPDAASSPVTGVDVENKIAPDIDLNWFYTKNLAVELLLTIPQEHEVTLNGASLGKVSHLPPALLLQYHYPVGETYRPYVGAGINYTFFTDRNLDGGLKLENGSFGPAIQAGMDVALQGNWYFNVDVKKIWIDSDVTDGTGAFVTHVDIDPLIVGAGIGYAFR
jgi:outer membrane protein